MSTDNTRRRGAYLVLALVLMASMIVTDCGQKQKTAAPGAEAVEADEYAVSEPAWGRIGWNGFGIPTNTGVASLAVFRDMLYAGVTNEDAGCEVWRYGQGVWSPVSRGGVRGRG